MAEKAGFVFFLSLKAKLQCSMLRNMAKLCVFGLTAASPSPTFSFTFIMIECVRRRQERRGFHLFKTFHGILSQSCTDSRNEVKCSEMWGTATH